MSADAGSYELRIFENPDALAQGLADEFVSSAQNAVAERGTFAVALAGGTTPKAAYRLLAQEPRRSAVGWGRVQVFFGDERCVPPTDDDSNYKMAAQTLLDRVGVDPRHVHRMRGEDSPQEAATAYAADLVATLGEHLHFDLILLGMGPDGHTASLFPGSDPRTDEAALVRAPYVEKLSSYRLTLTPLVINAARRAVIATEGLPKAPALYAVLRGPYNPIEHPVQIVAPIGGTLSWYVDRAAAAQLNATT